MSCAILPRHHALEMRYKYILSREFRFLEPINRINSFSTHERNSGKIAHTFFWVHRFIPSLKSRGAHKLPTSIQQATDNNTTQSWHFRCRSRWIGNWASHLTITDNIWYGHDKITTKKKENFWPSYDRPTRMNQRIRESCSFEFHSN